VRPVYQAPATTRHVVPDADRVVSLLREQAPHLAGPAVRPSHASGSSNWVFRLGDAHAVRLPRSDGYVRDLLKEVRWLPRLGPALPVPVPAIEFVGEASDLFPLPWAVVSWVPGDMPAGLDSAQQVELAETLGEFMQSLHAVDASGVRAGAEHWGYRSGEPVTDTIDGWADEVASCLSDLFDPRKVRQAWRRLREVPPATTPPCWVHTDLSAENVLIRPAGRLTGVIDFGGLGVGDRSVDLLYAWSMFEAPARHVLRTASGADDATWLRARAWAFVGPGLVTIESYRHTLTHRTSQLTAMVETIAAEVGVELR
jgi:aminoglycoside phosphotransferase (APT) family kinase protein